ncbi:MAG: toxin-antitoxin system HicB family antitoxin [Betaproteobacteria bacterium]
MVLNLQASGEPVPVAPAEKNDGGKSRVRIPPQVHRNLAPMAAEQGVGLNRLASAKLAT